MCGGTKQSFTPVDQSTEKSYGGISLSALHVSCRCMEHAGSGSDEEGGLANPYSGRAPRAVRIASGTIDERTHDPGPYVLVRDIAQIA